MLVSGKGVRILAHNSCPSGHRMCECVCVFKRVWIKLVDVAGLLVRGLVGLWGHLLG